MNADFNIELYKLLAGWNPMNFEDVTMGDQEIYDCMDIIHQKYDRDKTVKRIQQIYQFSFDQHLASADINRILNEVDHLNQQCML
ncbi:DUF1871 family protein [Macrococcus lamae]|uniref:DUF1871 family protein n=1 Tax=Macrococcus lamae TaxID=198484 RepID=A0A4R6BVW1_9STAP|nr:DUF1871 family protein [Macrococcus lamae]TDM12524.1 DUF1871 family protein [Macrococcus lamae]